ncbi:MAG: hypothetical protein A2W19_12100 [Spirochaetes bacterium RBG_16_49_21]|nr:MAG: hypothetical protein A2W19_12100 [Spirochaetes bacterium RBG_16_49_21]
MSLAVPVSSIIKGHFKPNFLQSRDHAAVIDNQCMYEFNSGLIKNLMDLYIQLMQNRCACIVFLIFGKRKF